MGITMGSMTHCLGKIAMHMQVGHQEADTRTTRVPFDPGTVGELNRRWAGSKSSQVPPYNDTSVSD